MNVVAKLISEKDSGFISVMELVEAISAKHGSTKDEAMIFLFRALRETPEIHRPKVLRYDAAAGPEVIGYRNSHILWRMEKYIKAPPKGFQDKLTVANGIEDDLPF